MQMLKDTPQGWPRISSALCYQDPAAMIDWLCAAFGFELRLKVEGENGRIEHSELTYGDGLIMVGGERDGSKRGWGIEMKSPASLGRCNTQTLTIYVDDADAHSATARAAGAIIVDEPAIHDYGDGYWVDRSYGAADPEGHLWWFTQRVRG